MRPGIGHNRGPDSGAGRSWRRHCWQRARADLLPRLPIEILRHRVRRARELGLDYRSYASIRAASGHDVVAFLFSTNALRMLNAGSALPTDRVEKLASLRACDTLVAVQAPLSPHSVMKRLGAQDVSFKLVSAAPGPWQSWPETRATLRRMLVHAQLPADGVVVIGETALERDWCAAAGLAFHLGAERYFAPPAPSGAGT